MKNPYICILITVLFIFSCGKEDDGSGTVMPDANTAPTVPNQIFPLNNTLCTDNNVIFEWNASSDAEGNLITYRVDVAEDNSFSVLSHTLTSFSESSLITLETGKAYYWRIKAVDSRNAESAYSPAMQFLTEGEGISNHIPFAPTLIAPISDAELDATEVLLSWETSDLDGDPLSFDVYLDTNENPSTMVSENQTETNYNATSLAPSTKYYFKIIVKDDKGATSIGQIWSFRTK